MRNKFFMNEEISSKVFQVLSTVFSWNVLYLKKPASFSQRGTTRFIYKKHKLCSKMHMLFVNSYLMLFWNQHTTT